MDIAIIVDCIHSNDRQMSTLVHCMQPLFTSLAVVRIPAHI